MILVDTSIWIDHFHTSEPDGAEQVYIHRAQSTPPELTPIHERHHFLMRQDREPLEALKEGQHPMLVGGARLWTRDKRLLAACRDGGAAYVEEP